MLVLHPTSRCDICLDDYTCINATSSPHTIPCGHIFCLGCLRTLYPSVCPLCRKEFRPGRIRKLHADTASDEPDRAGVPLDSHSAVLLQRIAMVSGVNTPDEDILEVLKDTNEWLSADGNDLNSTQPLRAAVEVLNRYRTAQQTLADKSTECENLKRELSNLQRSPGRRNVADHPPHVSVRRQILFDQRNCPYYGFTNFSLRPVSYKGKMYPTSMHLYESFKFQKHRPDLAEHIRLHCSSPDDALLEARRFQSTVRSDWMNVNIRKMDETLWHKFTQHSDLKHQLLLTWDAELIQDSNKDSFWGVGPDWRGRNELGKALERLRTKLRGS